MRLCCSTPRIAVAGARSATSAPALCRSMKRFGASATIHTSWNCARHSGEPRQPIDAQDERRSLETTVTRSQLSGSPEFGQEVKLGLLLRRTDLDDEQTEAVFGGVQGEGCA